MIRSESPAKPRPERGALLEVHLESPLDPPVSAERQFVMVKRVVTGLMALFGVLTVLLSLYFGARAIFADPTGAVADPSEQR